MVKKKKQNQQKLPKRSQKKVKLKVSVTLKEHGELTKYQS